MTLFAFLTLILDYVGYFETLQSFVQDQMAKTLQEFGDINSAAAMRALADMKKSSKPERELDRAMNCLYSAYHTFYSTASKRHLNPIISVTTKVNGYKKACECAVLMALCYTYIREEALQEEYLQQAKTCFEEYNKEVNLAIKLKISMPDVEELKDVGTSLRDFLFEDTSRTYFLEEYVTNSLLEPFIRDIHTFTEGPAILIGGAAIAAVSVYGYLNNMKKHQGRRSLALAAQRVTFEKIVGRLRNLMQTSLQ